MWLELGVHVCETKSMSKGVSMTALLLHDPFATYINPFGELPFGAFYLLDGSSSSWSFRLRRKSATRYRSNRLHITIKVN